MPGTDGLVITVVTPTLNAERYLPGCLASIQAQSYPNIEHLMIDGGSTDRTFELAAAAPIVRWVSLVGANQSAAINAGFRSAAGDIITWLNADDEYAPDALGSVASAFANEPDLEVVFGDCEVIDQRGRVLSCKRPGPYDFERLLTRGNYLPQPAVFLSRRVLDRVGLLDETLEFGMDYDLWLRLRGARTRYLPRVLSRFRWHPESKSARNLSGNWSELVTIVRRYGGGWTLPLAWSFARAHLTAARLRAMRVLRA
jgi:glycosyltransferase involved in cell wall biosynthesis